MHIATMFLITAALLFTLAFIPDMFPRCSCCRKIKFRLFFKVHKPQKLAPGYGGSKSVCKKCCMKYYINDLKDLDLVYRIRKKAEADVRNFTIIPGLDENCKKDKA